MVLHVAVIVMDDLLLQYNPNEYVIKQTLLTAVKIEILPLLFAGALLCCSDICALPGAL